MERRGRNENDRRPHTPGCPASVSARGSAVRRQDADWAALPVAGGPWPIQVPNARMWPRRWRTSQAQWKLSARSPHEGEQGGCWVAAPAGTGSQRADKNGLNKGYRPIVLVVVMHLSGTSNCLGARHRSSNHLCLCARLIPRHTRRRPSAGSMRPQSHGTRSRGGFNCATISRRIERASSGRPTWFSSIAATSCSTWRRPAAR